MNIDTESGNDPIANKYDEVAPPPPPLMRAMMEIQFLIAVQFIFPVVFLPPYWSEIFPTLLSTVPHQYLSDLSIFPKKEKLKKKGDMTGLLEITFQGSRLMEIDASIEAFGFAGDVICPTRRCTIVDKYAIIF